MKTIEINTTQNVAIEYPLATLGSRFVAQMIDVIVCAIFLYLFYWLVLTTFIRSFSSMFIQIFLWLLPILFYSFYFLLTEAIFKGQSVGKMAVGTRVVRIDGAAPSWGDLVLRSLLLWVDAIFSGFIIGGLLISSTDRRQRLGDMAAGTVVIKTAKDARQIYLDGILRIHTTENYTPIYPQVRDMSEEDMLSIRAAILRYQEFRNAAHVEAIDDLVLHIKNILSIRENTGDKIEFLKILIRDYIALTR
jgi:uncharacterized RDD family membrane protein YckC